MELFDFLLQIIEQRTIEELPHADLEAITQLLDVVTFAVVETPFTRSLIVDCVMPEMVLILLIVTWCSSQSSYMRLTTASETVILIPPKSSVYR